MDKVLFIDKEGRAYYAEPPDESVFEIADVNSLSYTKRLNRIINCGWCLWAISSDFEVYLYVYKKKNSIQVIEQTYEYQV